LYFRSGGTHNPLVRQGFSKVDWAALKPPSSAAFLRQIRAKDGAASNMSRILEKPCLSEFK
jgi:hypothetical protein